MLLLSRAPTEPRPFSALHPTPSVSGWGTTRTGRGHSWDSWAWLTPGVSQPIWAHAQHTELGAGGANGRCSEWCHLFLEVCVRCDGVLLCWRWLNSCLPVGSGEWTPCSALLVHVAFAIKLPVSQVFSCSSFRFSPLCHWWGWASGYVGLSCWLWLNHDIYKMLEGFRFGGNSWEDIEIASRMAGMLTKCHKIWMRASHLSAAITICCLFQSPT